MSSGFQLAELNVAQPLAPVDSPLLADFNAQLDTVNAAAEAADGFVWRLQDEDGNATSFRAFDSETMLINLSVWESIEALRAFVYGAVAEGLHKGVMRRRAEWFESAAQEHLVLWWLPAGELPDLAEAERRLLLLRERGPTPEAFSFRQSFDAPAPAAERSDLGAGG